MAKWDATASTGLSAVKSATNSSDADMIALKDQINAWANTHPDGTTFIPFGRFRDHGVSVRTAGGWVKSVIYSDKL